MRSSLGLTERHLFSVSDTIRKKQRSLQMATVRSKGNKATELKLASILRSAGIKGWRRHQPLPGRPDFIFREARLAIFVDGCFWHGCRWHCRMPKTRLGFWYPKIARNRKRDRSVGIMLRRRGWRVIRLWEHSLSNPLRTVSLLQTALDSSLRNG